MAWMNITCQCGHTDDFTEFCRTAMFGELSKGHYTTWGATMNCECGGEYILDGSWYVCQECHEVAGDFSDYEEDEPDDYTDIDYENDCRINGGQG